MGVNPPDFESFEQQFLALIGEFQTISTSEGRLREALRGESARAEAAEAARAAAERAAAEARAGAAAAAAGAAQAAAALARAHDQHTALKMRVDLAERQRGLLEERCAELAAQTAALEREAQQLRPLRPANTLAQRQYHELLERVKTATGDAKTESSRLEAELRRVERCAGAGGEVRERARLAAAAHARERRLAAADLAHAAADLCAANAEVARLNSVITELQIRLNEDKSGKLPTKDDGCSVVAETLAEVRAALEAEKAGSAKLERALAAALKDNAALAATVHAADETVKPPPAPEPEGAAQTNISALDSFLAE